jgi:hypothetical protein
VRRGHVKSQGVSRVLGMGAEHDVTCFGGSPRPGIRKYGYAEDGLDASSRTMRVGLPEVRGRVGWTWGAYKIMPTSDSRHVVIPQVNISDGSRYALSWVFSIEFTWLITVLRCIEGILVVPSHVVGRRQVSRNHVSCYITWPI